MKLLDRVRLQTLVVACLCLAGTGCEKKPAAEAETSAPEPQASESPEPPSAVATLRPFVSSLTQFQERTGVALPDGAKVITQSSGGVPDPSVGFHEWVVFAPSAVALPGANTSAEPGSSLPLSNTVAYVQAKIAGTRIEGARAALSAKWERGEFEFNATSIRTESGDYILVQQFRKR